MLPVIRSGLKSDCAGRAGSSGTRQEDGECRSAEVGPCVSARRSECPEYFEDFADNEMLCGLGRVSEVCSLVGFRFEVRRRAKVLGARRATTQDASQWAAEFAALEMFPYFRLLG